MTRSNPCCSASSSASRYFPAFVSSAIVGERSGGDALATARDERGATVCGDTAGGGTGSSSGSDGAAGAALVATSGARRVSSLPLLSWLQIDDTLAQLTAA